MNHQKASTIVETTQMLAHDVRKPFSMTLGFLKALENADSLEQIKRLNAMAIPKVEDSFKYVNDMLGDIMEFGTDSELNLESIDLYNLAEHSVLTSFSPKDSENLTFHYNIKHTKEIMADPHKMNRVFSNIISNAAQAMKHRGKIWFKTEDSPSRTVIVTIGNSDSYISSKDRSRIFDSFYTKNKKGGTGLGLAIVKKVIEEHGGQVWCTSHREVGTEFHFSLPVSIQT